MKERIKDGEKQLEEFKKLSLEKDAEEAAATEGDQKPVADLKKKKNQKPKTSSKKKGKGKK